MRPFFRELIAFTAAEAADGHCEPAAIGIRGERLFDWLDEQVLMPGLTSPAAARPTG